MPQTKQFNSKPPPSITNTFQWAYSRNFIMSFVASIDIPRLQAAQKCFMDCCSLRFKFELMWWHSRILSMCTAQHRLNSISNLCDCIQQRIQFWTFCLRTRNCFSRHIIESNRLKMGAVTGWKMTGKFVQIEMPYDAHFAHSGAENIT